MTVKKNVSRETFGANGATTAFQTEIEAYTDTDIMVYFQDANDVLTLKTQDQDYSISGLKELPDDNNKVLISFSDAPAAPNDIIVTRRVLPLQLTDIVNQAGFFPDIIETQLDRIVMMVQQNEERLTRELLANTAPTVTGGRSFSSRAALVELISEGASFDTNYIYEAEGEFYVYRGAAFVAGPSDLPGFDPYGEVTPQHFGAQRGWDNQDIVNQANASPAFQAAMQFCVAQKRLGKSDGNYRCEESIRPNGRYSWHWGMTQLAWDYNDWDTFDRANKLNEVQSRPSGAVANVPSGKHVLFDVAGSEKGTNTGFLHIRVAFPEDMTVANRAVIPQNIVAITASDQSSPNMNWDFIMISGSSFGFWQGNMASSDLSDILPYTGWSIKNLFMQFCRVAMVGGVSGNAYDDIRVSVGRFTRCQDYGTIRSDINFGSLFLNGYQENTDIETSRITVTAGSNNFTLTQAISGLQEGSVLHIYRVNYNEQENPQEEDKIPLVTRVTSVNPDGLGGTIEDQPEVDGTNETFHVDPPALILFVANLNTDICFIEEANDAIYVDNGGKFRTRYFKVSDGRGGFRRNCPIILSGTRDAEVTIGLHDRAENNSNVKYIVGVPNLQTTASGNAFNNCVVHVESGLSREGWVKSKPVGMITLPADKLQNAWLNREGFVDTGHELQVRYTNGKTQLYCGKAGYNESYVIGHNGGFEVEANLRGNKNMTGVTVTGSGSVTGGVFSKPSTGVSDFHEDVALEEGERTRVLLKVENYVAGFLTVEARSSVDNSVVQTLESVRSNGKHSVYFDPQSGADRIAVTMDAGTQMDVSMMKVQTVETM